MFIFQYLEINCNIRNYLYFIFFVIAIAMKLKLKCYFIDLFSFCMILFEDKYIKKKWSIMHLSSNFNLYACFETRYSRHKTSKNFTFSLQFFIYSWSKFYYSSSSFKRLNFYADNAFEARKYAKWFAEI